MPCLSTSLLEKLLPQIREILQVNSQNINTKELFMKKIFFTGVLLLVLQLIPQLAYNQDYTIISPDVQVDFNNLSGSGYSVSGTGDTVSFTSDVGYINLGSNNPLFGMPTTTSSKDFTISCKVYVDPTENTKYRKIFFAKSNDSRFALIHKGSDIYMRREITVDGSSAYFDYKFWAPASFDAGAGWYQLIFTMGLRQDDDLYYNKLYIGKPNKVRYAKGGAAISTKDTVTVSNFGGWYTSFGPQDFLYNDNIQWGLGNADTDDQLHGSSISSVSGIVDFALWGYAMDDMEAKNLFDCNYTSTIDNCVDFASDDDLVIYVLLGQSNMAGRCENSSEAPCYSEFNKDDQPEDNGYLLNLNNRFVPATHPFNQYSTVRKPSMGQGYEGDGVYQGYNIGYTFIENLQQLGGSGYENIGLIVNARGGTKSSNWLKSHVITTQYTDGEGNPTTSKGVNNEAEYYAQNGVYDLSAGRNLFKESVYRIKQALTNHTNATLGGIVWMNGEGEYSSTSTIDTWYSNVKTIFEDLRDTINILYPGEGYDDLPIYICELPQHSVVKQQIADGEIDENATWDDGGSKYKGYDYTDINAKLDEFFTDNTISNVYVVPSAELKMRYDGIHYLPEAQRNIGARLAEEVVYSLTTGLKETSYYILNNDEDECFCLEKESGEVKGYWLSITDAANNVCYTSCNSWTSSGDTTYSFKTSNSSNDYYLALNTSDKDLDVSENDTTLMIYLEDTENVDVSIAEENIPIASFLQDTASLGAFVLRAVSIQDNTSTSGGAPVSTVSTGDILTYVAIGVVSLAVVVAIIWAVTRCKTCSGTTSSQSDIGSLEERTGLNQQTINSISIDNVSPSD